MVEVSCFYIHFKINSINFTFIKYEKFVKIIFQEKRIVMKIENLRNYQILFQFYLLSLLCTEDVSKIKAVNFRNKWRNMNDYAISTLKYWKYSSYCDVYDNITLEKSCTRNPFLSQEPKRETTIKKLNKLLKMINNYYNKQTFRHPSYYINNFIIKKIAETNIENVIQYEKEIYLLSCIRGLNRDIYSAIKKFM
jgi:hypothetical protein